MKDSLRRESVVDIQDDGDPYWFNNPQYRLSADEPLEVGLVATPMARQVVETGWYTITMQLFSLADSDNGRWIRHTLVTGVHQLDAAGQEVSKPSAGKLPYCFRSGTYKAPYDAQEVGTWLLSSV